MRKISPKHSHYKRWCYAAMKAREAAENRNVAAARRYATIARDYWREYLNS